MAIIGDKQRRNILVSTDHGSMIVNRFDYIIGDNNELVGHGQWLLDHGNCDTIETFVCFRILETKSNPVMFDIGSNIGTITTMMANILRNIRIYCFEPQEDVFKILCGNLAINNLHNCHPFNLALGKENKTIPVKEPDYSIPNDFGIFSLLENKIQTTDKIKFIDICTLDNFVNKHQIKNIDLLKIDAEGMDLDVLQGAKLSIEKFNPYILIEYSDNRKSIKSELENYLGHEYYNFITVGNNLLSVPKQYPMPNLENIPL